MMIKVQGLNTHFNRLGDRGQELLLLHGWGPQTVSSNKHMLPLARQLQNRYRLTLLDFPGHGEKEGQDPGVTEIPKEDWSVRDFADWTLAFMDAVGLGRVSIIAHSFGGRVALNLAARYPNRFDTLILTGCAGLRPKPSFKRTVKTYAFKVGKFVLKGLGSIKALQAQTGQWTEKLRQMNASKDYLAAPEALRGSFSLVVREDLSPLIKKITHPVLLVYGDRDQATPLWMGQKIKAMLPDARLLVYRGEDHFAYLNQVKRFANAADAYLQGEA